MKMKMLKNFKQKILKFGTILTLLSGSVFALDLINILTTLIFQDAEIFSDFLYNKNEYFNLSSFRLFFWLFISGLIIYFSFGGELKALNIFKKND